MIIFLGAPLSGENTISAALGLKHSRTSGLDFYERRIQPYDMKKKLAKSLEGKSIICDWQLSFCSPLVKEVFPQATIYHLVRNGLDCVKSYKKMKYYNGNKLNLPFKGVKFTSFEKCCYLWNGINDYIMSMEGNYRIFFENISVERLFEVTKEKVKPFYVCPYKIEDVALSDEEEKIFWEICGETMKRLGYRRK